MKYFYIAFGSIFLFLGILGIFLPVLPTTPFLLLAAAFYFRGSYRLYSWLLNHKYLGTYIRAFREDKAIPLRAKILSMILMWSTIFYSVLFVVPWWWVNAFLLCLSSCISYYILSLKTLRN